MIPEPDYYFGTKFFKFQYCSQHEEQKRGKSSDTFFPSRVQFHDELVKTIMPRGGCMIDSIIVLM